MKTSMSIIFFFFVLVLPISAMLVYKSPVEDCIRRNIAAESLSPSSTKPKTSPYDTIIDEFCRQESRIVMHFLKLKGRFPAYYVRALCRVFVNDENKVKDYVMKKWLTSSKKLIDSLSCAVFFIKDDNNGVPEITMPEV